MDVVVGAPIYREGAYILDKFIQNQQAIQQEYPACELVLATGEADFVEELEQYLTIHKIRGRSITYDIWRPSYARSNIWNIAQGREAIRHYLLSQTDADYYMSIDADMIYERDLIRKMLAEIEGYDVIFNGYPFRGGGLGLTGAGCMMANRATLEKVGFRCIEFRNADWMSEDSLFEMDAFRNHCRIKKGVFVHTSHYMSENDVAHGAPQSVGLYRRIMTSALVRYLLIRTSLIIHRNVPRRLWRARVATGTKIGSRLNRRN
jgi:hypothetical protein